MSITGKFIAQQRARLKGETTDQAIERSKLELLDGNWYSETLGAFKIEADKKRKERDYTSWLLNQRDRYFKSSRHLKLWSFGELDKVHESIVDFLNSELQNRAKEVDKNIRKVIAKPETELPKIWVDLFLDQSDAPLYDVKFRKMEIDGESIFENGSLKPRFGTVADEMIHCLKMVNKLKPELFKHPYRGKKRKAINEILRKKYGFELGDRAMSNYTEVRKASRKVFRAMIP